MAIAFAPLNKGETLESNLSRYAKGVGMTSFRPVYTQLFGENACCHTRILPAGIRRFCEAGRDYWSTSAKQFVRDNTPYHYYTNFANKECRKTEFERMIDIPGSAVSRLGTRRKADKDRFALRYCDECVRACRGSGIEPYFDVVHQLPNVIVCPIHGQSLRCIDLAPTAHTRALAVTLEDFATPKDRRLTDEYPSSCIAAAADVARRSAHIVSRFDESFVKFPYEKMFREAGLSLQSGTLNHAKLWDAFNAYFGEKFCSDTGIERSAIHRKFWGHETDARICPRPFRYLALQSLLAYRASLGGSPSLAAIRRVPARNGTAPLCCQPTLRTRRGMLEVTCETDLKMLAERFACSGRFHKPDDRYARVELAEWTGSLVFSCTCERRISVAFRKGGTQAVKVLEHGSPCLKEFESLVGRGLTPFAAAAQLEVSNSVAYRWERRIAGVTRSLKITAERVEENREQWRSACAQLPLGRGHMDLRQKLPSTYSFLLRNDTAWLRGFNRNFVANRKSHQRDSQSQLLSAARESLAAATPPVWMSRVAIWESSGIGGRPPLLSSPDRDLVGHLVESKSAYRDRVIEFWMRELGLDVQVHYWSFLKRCHIADRTLTLEQRTHIKSWLSARGQSAPVDGASRKSP